MKLRRYKLYPYERDPLIDDVEGLAFEAGLRSRADIAAAAREQGMGAQTPVNWFFKGTKRPQAATLRAFGRACGYDLIFVKGIRKIVSKPRPKFEKGRRRTKK